MITSACDGAWSQPDRFAARHAATITVRSAEGRGRHIGRPCAFAPALRAPEPLAHIAHTCFTLWLFGCTAPAGALLPMQPRLPAARICAWPAHAVNMPPTPASAGSSTWAACATLCLTRPTRCSTWASRTTWRPSLTTCRSSGRRCFSARRCRSGCASSRSSTRRITRWSTLSARTPLVRRTACCAAGARDSAIAGVLQ